ncbi:CPBP family intramembrane glutamic endopeptidase [Dyadobacter arcticus]|uniref:CAAX prenyl protease 2/Lysostaphin resistance protein A-like domain-containing protein n=1 Tax=Dyadobacter arcticus TaxID=1078754 RepID=A0ABX0UMY5_9BACT|nr:CPBP family intramembrane glutamic endopeptidase [Dyadobacter arcticus]NIJ53010.1 hypothetical protein [Dyadobacter arcticus]
METKYKYRRTFDYLEIIVLLTLPLPFLNLNIFYILIVLTIVGFSKYLRHERWRNYGFNSTNKRNLVVAIVVGVIFGISDNYFLEPFLTKLLVGKTPDLSALQDTKGNIKKALILLVIGWLVGGFFEEFFFRGYLFNRINSVIHSIKLQKWIVIIITSIVFAFAHAYQDLAGIISAFYFSVIMGLLYFYFKKNIWYVVLIHGIYDTFGVLMLYTGW